MHGEALDLPAEDLHPGGGHDAPHVGDHGLAEYLVDQPMVPHVSGVSHVLHTQSIIGIFFILCRLNVDPSLCNLASSADRRGHLLLLGILHDRLTSGLGLDVLLVCGTVVVLLQLGLVLNLLGLVLVRVLALLPLRQVPPHLTYYSPDFPQFQLGILIFNLIPDLPAVSHVRHQWLLGSLGWFWSPMSRQSLLTNFLGVETWVSILLLDKWVGLHVILLLLSHKIRPHGTGRS